MIKGGAIGTCGVAELGSSKCLLCLQWQARIETLTGKFFESLTGLKKEIEVMKLKTR
jgi:hypothetical protein